MKTMKRLTLKAIFQAAFLLACISVYGQSNYRPGFIITLEQDTVYGQIDFRTDKMNAQRCVFKMHENTVPVTYLPFEIAGYRFTDDGKFYVSRKIKLGGNKDVALPVFLEYLVQGLKSLYYYESVENGDIYFIQDGERLVMLDAPGLEKMKDEGMFVSGQTDRYVPTLQYVFRDCPGLSSKIRKTSFTHKGLINITKEYHYAVCKSNEECIEFENRNIRQKGVQVLFTPYVGVVQYNYLSIDNLQQPGLSYMAGISIAITNKRWQGILSGVLDFSLSRLDMILNQPYNASEYDYTTTSFSFKLGACLTYPKGKVRPFVEGGVDFFKRMKNDYFGDLYPGGYFGVGANIKLTRSERQALVIRARFERVRDVLGDDKYKIESGPFLNGWSAVVGYTF